MIEIPLWFVILGVLFFFLMILIMTCINMAQRLNRLHIRTDSARISLEGALAARGSIIAVLQPELAAQVSETTRVVLRAAEMGARSDLENMLMNSLSDDSLHAPAFVEAATRVDLSARFYNDAVADTLMVRHRPLVRFFRLAGRAPLPEYYEARSTIEIRRV